MQQINLFLPEFAPTPQRLGLRALLQLLAGLTVLLFLIGLFLFQQAQQQRQLSATARRDLDNVIQQISQSHGNTVARQQISAQLALLQRQLTEQRALLADLQRREQRQTSGFAALLRALAEHHDGRLWLTHIAQRNDHLELAGETLHAAAVPAWLNRLQDSPPVQGLRFAGLQLTRLEAKPGVLAFTLQPTVSDVGISNQNSPNLNKATNGDGDHAATER